MNKTAATKTPAQNRKNGPRSDGKPPKASSAERFRRYNSPSVKMVPEMYPEDLLLAYEPGHPGEPSHVPFRYDLVHNPDNVRDLHAIEHEQGGKLQQVPKVSILLIDGKEVAVCDDGSRGCHMLRDINKRRVAAGKERYKTIVDFVIKGATGASSFMRHVYGNFHSEDGLMTRAKKMATLFYGDEKLGIEKHTAEQVGAIWGVGVEVVEVAVDSQRGIVMLSDRFGGALESGKVSLMNARHAAAIGVSWSLPKRHAAMDRFLDALLALKSPPSRARSQEMAKLAEAGKDPSGKPAEATGARERQTFGKRSLDGLAKRFEKLADKASSPAEASRLRYTQAVLVYMQTGKVEGTGLDPKVCAMIDAEMGRKREAGAK